jgi:hypothetical protein
MTDAEIIVELRKRAKAERGKAHKAREMAAYFKVPAQDQSRANDIRNGYLANDIRNGYLADAAIADSEAAFYCRCADIAVEFDNLKKEHSYDEE